MRGASQRPPPRPTPCAGIVPPCLEAAPEAIAGTFLLPADNLGLASGGFCDATPPSCDPDVGCR
jgi:hypothetical protein